MKKAAAIVVLIALAVILAFRTWKSGVVPDDARAAGKLPADFPQTASRAFDAMDGGIRLADDEVRGRNTWLFWTAGDQVFWDRMARFGLGTGDLLKTIDSRRRSSRFREMGLVNEPSFLAAAAPDQYGLWIDQASDEDEKDLDPAVYGRSTGIIGLRLFPNPAFDADAQKKWDGSRYYTDAQYAGNPSLVRPYTVGMSCAFCHVSFDPLRPPANPESPQWSNLSSSVGNQYIDAAAVFASGVPADSYVVQLLSTWPRGTIDTSFLATDNINNPSNINSLYNTTARLAEAKEEHISGGALHLTGTRANMPVPHVLKDGADSVGLSGALSRVYVSIGTYSQEWLRDHNALVGGTPQRPFDVARALRGSVYWQATNDRLPNLSAFLLKLQSPRLAEAPGGRRYLTSDSKILERGKIVFAENCARCHSSKQPPNIAPDSPQYLAWMRDEVRKPNFLDANFLSTDTRIRLSTVQTNAARALASNATRGHVWDNFSSETYKTLPSAGEIEVTNLDGTKSTFSLPAGGRGYYRVPSLQAAWATAPFLHNNALGAFTGDPSVSGRMTAFDDSVEKLLWPEKRMGMMSIFRTTQDSYIQIPLSYVPKALQNSADANVLRIGPIPAGTPIDLLANLDLDLGDNNALNRMRLVVKVQKILSRITSEHLDGAHARDLMQTLVPDLLRDSNCPDFIQDRGHYFGTRLADEDKRALVAFMKTF